MIKIFLVNILENYSYILCRITDNSTNTIIYPNAKTAIIEILKDILMHIIVKTQVSAIHLNKDQII